MLRKVSSSVGDDQNAFADGFSERLRGVLRRKHAGKLPKAAQLARRFNASRSGQHHPVSAEAVRRWIRGLSTPELERFSHLCACLELNRDEVVMLLGLVGGVSAEREALVSSARPVRPGIRSVLHDLIDAVDERLLLAAANLAVASSVETHHNGASGGGCVG